MHYSEKAGRHGWGAVASFPTKGSRFMQVIERIGRALMRQVRNGLIARAFAVLPLIEQNEYQLIKLLDR